MDRGDYKCRTTCATNREHKSPTACWRNGGKTSCCWRRSPTIGLLLCREKDKFEVEYALRHIRTPIGVAEWQTKLVRRLPVALRPSLPTVNEIEAALAPLTRDSGAKT
ncbi:MAG: hypothetical protein BWK77_08880 [Verrucomicrobia bacterium A1]|nr:MAG: hypothetical protein BWK77_08880 [Verrucomicrobia bacterium A1]